MATPTSAYRVMRKLWPHLPWSLRRRLGRRAPSRPARATVGGGLLEGIDAGAAEERLRADGYIVFDQCLPAATVAHLRALAGRLPSTARPTGERVVVQDTGALDAPRYDLDERDLLADPEVQSLLADPSLRDLAEAYLGGEAVNDLVAMWWSVARPGAQASSAAAQQFHTDRDRLSFVKFFVYLTDVDDDHGPHVYVRGSHRRLPARLRADRRFRDDEVAAVYGADAFVTLRGPAGTVFAADTAGLHKGMAPRDGRRLVFQLEYATSLFGAPYVSGATPVLQPCLRTVAEARPRSYERLLVR